MLQPRYAQRKPRTKPNHEHQESPVKYGGQSPGSGVGEIRSLLEFYGTAGTRIAAGRGCLLCNTAVEFGPQDPGGSGFVQKYFDRLSSAFCGALSNARDRGELPQSLDPHKEAAFFTASVLELFVMLRAKSPRKSIQDAARVAIEHLEALR